MGGQQCRKQLSSNMCSIFESVQKVSCSILEDKENPVEETISWIPIFIWTFVIILCLGLVIYRLRKMRKMKKETHREIKSDAEATDPCSIDTEDNLPIRNLQQSPSDVSRPSIAMRKSLNDTYGIPFSDEIEEFVYMEEFGTLVKKETTKDQQIEKQRALTEILKTPRTSTSLPSKADSSSETSSDRTDSKQKQGNSSQKGKSLSNVFRVFGKKPDTKQSDSEQVKPEEAGEDTSKDEIIHLDQPEVKNSADEQSDELKATESMSVLPSKSSKGNKVKKFFNKISASIKFRPVPMEKKVAYQSLKNVHDIDAGSSTYTPIPFDSSYESLYARAKTDLEIKKTYTQPKFNWFFSKKVVNKDITTPLLPEPNTSNESAQEFEEKATNHDLAQNSEAPKVGKLIDLSGEPSKTISLMRPKSRKPIASFPKENKIIRTLDATTDEQINVDFDRFIINVEKTPDSFTRKKGV